MLHSMQSKEFLTLHRQRTMANFEITWRIQLNLGRSITTSIQTNKFNLTQVSSHCWRSQTAERLRTSKYKKRLAPWMFFTVWIKGSVVMNASIRCHSRISSIAPFAAGLCIIHVTWASGLHRMFRLHAFFCLWVFKCRVYRHFFP